MDTKPRTVCFCQPVASMISASVAPLDRFIIAITSAFLLLRSEALSTVGLPGAFWAALAFLVAFPALLGCSGFAAADSAACSFPASGWMAAQTRATAFLRSWNFLTGVWPGIPFQISTKRLIGHSADTLASAAWESKWARPVASPWLASSALA